MILKVFAVHDAKAEAYMQPFFMANKGTAIRAMTETLTGASNQFQKYPEDFTLSELGEYDDSNGMMKPHPTPLPICKVIELKAPSSAPQLQSVI